LKSVYIQKPCQNELCSFVAMSEPSALYLVLTCTELYLLLKINVLQWFLFFKSRSFLMAVNSEFIFFVDINKYYYINASKVWRVLSKVERVTAWNSTKVVVVRKAGRLRHYMAEPCRSAGDSPASTNKLRPLRRLAVPNSTPELQINGPWVRVSALGAATLGASRLQLLILIYNIIVAHLLFLSVLDQISAGLRWHV
jgi:hypothetical protein